jgi:hypothetical protein
MDDVVSEATSGRLLTMGLLVALILLAGCSGTPGASTPTVGDAPTQTATPAPGTPAATPTPAPDTRTVTPTPAESTSTSTATATPAGEAYPPGYGPDGIEDPGEAAAAHAEPLTDGRGFVAIYNATVLDGENAAVRLGWRQAAETGSEEVAATAVMSDRGTQERYLVNDTVYIRTDPPGADNTEYDTVQTDYEVRNFTGSSVVLRTLAGASYAAPDSETADGTTFYRYNMTAAENPSVLFGGDISEEDVESFGGSVTVDEDGVVRRVAYEGVVTVNGTRERLGAGLTVGGMRETTVSEPEWLDEAKESS